MSHTFKGCVGDIFIFNSDMSDRVIVHTKEGEFTIRGEDLKGIAEKYLIAEEDEDEQAQDPPEEIYGKSTIRVAIDKELEMAMIRIKKLEAINMSMHKREEKKHKCYLCGKENGEMVVLNGKAPKHLDLEICVAQLACRIIDLEAPVDDDEEDLI